MQLIWLSQGSSFAKPGVGNIVEKCVPEKKYFARKRGGYIVLEKSSHGCVVFVGRKNKYGRRLNTRWMIWKFNSFSLYCELLVYNSVEHICY
jgi:hypothetical protein